MEPQPKPERQKLYLLEFIVDDINLDYCNMKQLACQPDGETVMMFKFLDLGPFRMGESDFCPKRKTYIEGCTGTGNIKNGKSCLFGLTPTKAELMKSKMVVICDVYKEFTTVNKKTMCSKTKCYHYGTAIIPAMSMFEELVESVTNGGETIYSKHIKDCFKIKNLETGDLVGHLVAYIRLSCFNEMIINKFRMDKSKEVDYKNEKGYYNFKYNKQEPCQEKEQACTCPIPGTGLPTNGPCKCPSQYPAENCPQKFVTDPVCPVMCVQEKVCPFGCPPDVDPCGACPEICCLNRAKTRLSECSEENKKECKKKRKRYSGFRRSKEEEERDRIAYEEGLSLLMEKLKRMKNRFKMDGSVGGGGAGGAGTRGQGKGSFTSKDACSCLPARPPCRSSCSPACPPSTPRCSNDDSILSGLCTT